MIWQIDGYANRIDPECLGDAHDRSRFSGERWDAARELARQLDAVTVEEWIARNVSDRNVASLLRLCWQAVVTSNAMDASMLWLCMYARSAGGLMPLINAQTIKIEQGSQSFCNRMAQRLSERIRVGFVV